MPAVREGHLVAGREQGVDDGAADKLRAAEHEHPHRHPEWRGEAAEAQLLVASEPRVL